VSVQVAGTYSIGNFDSDDVVLWQQLGAVYAGVSLIGEIPLGTSDWCEDRAALSLVLEPGGSSEEGSETQFWTHGTITQADSGDPVAEFEDDAVLTATSDVEGSVEGTLALLARECGGLRAGSFAMSWSFDASTRVDGGGDAFTTDTGTACDFGWNVR
jgi:hypothetical protein